MLRTPLLAIAACTCLLPTVAEEANPVESSAEEAREEGLKPGEFEWHPESAPAGPVLIVVSRDDQIAYVYRNGIEIARSTVSTGKKGHGTPTGVFQILQKHKDHHSSTYNNAPMPYMQRLTWDGIALHAGKLPGYPASHGCIRLPYEFSQKLFTVTDKGGTVVITSEHAPPTNSLTPYEILKAAGKNLKEDGSLKPIDPSYAVRWNPEKQKEGSLSIVVSSGDKEIHVLRNGVEIGRAEFKFRSPDTELPTGIFLMLDRETDVESPVVEGRMHKAWALVAMDEKSRAGQIWGFASELELPEQFLRLVYDELTPGTLLVFTPENLDPSKRSDTGFSVITAEQHTEEAPAPAP